MCDEKVHVANFLVAKHSKSLLCHVFQSLTSLKAVGLKLGPTISICHICAENQVTTQRKNEDEDGDSPESETNGEEYYSDSDGYDYVEDEEEEDGENQVVPWSNSSYTPPSLLRLPSIASSSSSNSENVSFTSVKKNDKDGCCSSQLESKFAASNLASDHCFQESEIAGLSNSFRPLKLQMAVVRRGSDQVQDGGDHRFTKKIAARNRCVCNDSSSSL
ncbi:B-box type zinc finger family protein [Abeliophyllum distichum]|uniref:B-box type zinc finger family protein n=1 Tax=Abeliophyllum distichum TaxID=126358 RepID=A0ABD1TGG4_9LAMI